jgi:catechol 2,3-dioxygenase
MSDFRLNPRAHIGLVHLIVSRQESALRFYQEVIGLRPIQQQGSTVALGASDAAPLLLLTARASARPRPPRTTGLYHLAIRVPSRIELARSLQHLVEVGHPPQGSADHWVSEALYLSDPEGNGIEIYADRPRDQWPARDGQLQMGTAPLDQDGLLAELESDRGTWNGLAPDTSIGHVHLQVADLAQAERFYHDLLGFDLVLRYGAGALFLSAGGYHHHIGLNTWAGVGAPPPPPDAVGLCHYTIVLPDQSAQEDLIAHLQSQNTPFQWEDDALFLSDPSANALSVVTESFQDLLRTFAERYASDQNGRAGQ